jgi:hypothetical protein
VAPIAVAAMTANGIIFILTICSKKIYSLVSFNFFFRFSLSNSWAKFLSFPSCFCSGKKYPDLGLSENSSTVTIVAGVAPVKMYVKLLEYINDS